MALLIAVLWVQEAIFRTFQNRLAARILHLEAVIRDGTEGRHARLPAAQRMGGRHAPACGPAWRIRP